MRNDEHTCQGPLALNESLAVNILNLSDGALEILVVRVLLSLSNPSVGFIKFVEGWETCQNASTTHFLHFEPFSAVVTYEEGQTRRSGENVNEGGRLTLVDDVHLERPTGKFLIFIDIFDPGDFALKLPHGMIVEW